MDMMKKLMVAGGITIAGLTASLAVATPASAASPSNAGAACIQAGIGTLKSLDQLQAAAQKSIDYSSLADPDEGPIYADLPSGSYLSLGQVVKLHHTNPELFAWCQ